MVNNIIRGLRVIEASALHHRKTPDELINQVKSLLDVTDVLSQLGIISRNDADTLLNNNALSAKRQHDLVDAESFQEQRFKLNHVNQYYTEKIHGCHIAPTINPVNYNDIVNLTHFLISQLAK